MFFPKYAVPSLIITFSLLCRIGFADFNSSSSRFSGYQQLVLDNRSFEFSWTSKVTERFPPPEEVRVGQRDCTLLLLPNGGRYAETSAKPGKTSSLALERIDLLLRDGELLRVNSEVSVKDQLSLAGGNLMLRLNSAKAVPAEKEVSLNRITGHSRYNLTLGILMGVPAEFFFDGTKTTVALAGGEVDALQIDSKHGRVRLGWSDQSDIPISVSMDLKEHDIIPSLNVKVSEWERSSPPWPTGKLKQISARLDDVKFSSKLPVSWKTTETYVCDNGQVVEYIHEIKNVRTSIPKDVKDGTAKLPLVLPKGQSVLVVGAKQLEYVYDGDWAVPSANLLSGNSGKIVSRLWITMVVLVVVITAVFLLFKPKK